MPRRNLQQKIKKTPSPSQQPTESIPATHPPIERNPLFDDYLGGQDPLIYMSMNLVNLAYIFLKEILK